MKRILFLILLTVLGAMFYCILLEKFSLTFFITGFLISFFGVLIFNPGKKIRKVSLKQIYCYIRFILLLIYNIFASAISEIIYIFTKRNIKIEKKEHHDEINNITLAKAITLTPGTVTLESDNDNLTILAFENKDIRK